MKAFCTGFLGLQHFTPTLRRPASPIGKEAVSKSEVIKSVCAVHHVRVASVMEASGYYRQESEKLSRQISKALVQVELSITFIHTSALAR